MNHHILTQKHRRRWFGLVVFTVVVFIISFLGAVVFLRGPVARQAHATATPEIHRDEFGVVTIGKPVARVFEGCVAVISPESVSWLSFSPDGKTLLVAREIAVPQGKPRRGPVELWDSRTYKMRRSFGFPQVTSDMAGYAARVDSIDLSPNGKTLAIIHGDGMLRVWDSGTGRKTHEFAVDLGHVAASGGQPTNIVRFISSTRFLCTGINHTRLLSFDTKTGKVTKMKTSIPSFDTVGFSRNGTTLVVTRWQERGYPDGLHFYDIPSAKLLRTIKTPTGELYGDLVFSADASRLITQHGGNGGQAGQFKIWNIRTGQLLKTVPGALNASTAGFSGDDTHLVAGSEKAIHILSAKSLRILKTLKHQGVITALAFSPDGRKLAAGFDDSTIKIWSLKGN